MYSESDIDDAVHAGVLGPDVAAAFRNHVATQRNTPAVDEEQFRLLTGFNDVFVSLALLLVLGPLLFLDRSGLVIAAVAWGLAEFFTRHRRMALPSILLLLAFIIGAYRTATSLLGISVGLIGAGDRWGPALAVVGLVCAGAAALHWWRFKVPITIAAGIAALVGAVYALLAAALPGQARLWLALAFGIAVFALAMVWDGSDPDRRTRRSDVAFWLHLLAAPLIAHPIFSLLGVFDGRIAGGTAVIFALYGMFAIVSLAVDRRALLVSGLGYFGYAVYVNLSTERGVDDGAVITTAILVGAVLLLLSALWTKARETVVIYLPGVLRDRLPPIRREPIIRPA